MSPFRPDLIDCWLFRVGRTARDVARPEILLIRRAPGRILPGLWQCVSGSLEPGERVALAALREVAEETGFGPADIEAFYDLDLVNQFHEPSVDAVMTSAVFAVRLRPGAAPALSHEHDGAMWLSIDEAHTAVVWPGYRTAIERIRDDLADPERAAWFELTLGGLRASEPAATEPAATEPTVAGPSPQPID
jgi:8-oxo-dGTP pyrophosphatase MutT (NUDIX family)